MNLPNPTREQIEIITEGRALAEETSLPVLLVAVANAVANTANGATDTEAARIVAATTALFARLTTPAKGAVARRPS